MAHIELDDVSLTFRVRQHGKLSFKEFLVRRMFLRTVNPVLEVHALDHVSLQLGDGDRLGIIGHNGAGKSTLLRLLAGVYPPTSGRLSVAGRISSLFDHTLGFQTEANGWENIKLRAYLQGYTPAQIRGKMSEIAEFAELGEFMDTPIRHFSSGMLVRLGFAISTAIEPEILLVDEALSAGDISFQAKAQDRMSRLMSRARLIAIVSHDLGTIAKVCNRVLWMHQGQIRAFGPTEEVLAQYRGVRPGRGTLAVAA